MRKRILGAAAARSAVGVIVSAFCIVGSTARAGVPREKGEYQLIVECAGEGWHGALRVVALDGWEPFSSFGRHCPACLRRQVKVTTAAIGATTSPEPSPDSSTR